jgi:succinate dehydrogenase/fumarate reductase-like Fe-S protein
MCYQCAKFQVACNQFESEKDFKSSWAHLDKILNQYFNDSHKSEDERRKHRKEIFESVDRDLYCVLHYAVMYNNYWLLKTLLKYYKCGMFKNEAHLI